MRKLIRFWVMALMLVALSHTAWAQSPSGAPAAPASAAASTAPSPEAVASAAASAAPASTTSAAPASAAPLANPSSAASAAVAPASPLVVASGAPVESASPGASATAIIPPAPFTVSEPQDVSQTSFTVTIFQTFVLVLYFILCVTLIVCVMLSTTKNEGLTGIMGGGTSSAMFKGKKSAEEQLSLWTSRLAWAFLVSSLCIWLVMQRAS